MDDMLQDITEFVAEGYTYYGKDVVEATVVAEDVGEAFTVHCYSDGEPQLRWSFTNRDDAEEFAFLFVQE